MRAWITGERALQRKLARLNSRDARKVMRAATMSGLKVGARRLKAKVPKGDTKAIYKSVGAAHTKWKGGNPAGKFGVNVGRKKDRSAIHGYAVMAGTKRRKQRTTERNTGRIVGKRITRQVATASRSEMSAVIRKRMAYGIARVMSGKSVSDGGEFDRGLNLKEKSRARRKKLRAKKIAKYSKRVKRSAKRTQKRINRSLKRTTRTTRRVTKRATRKAKRLAKQTRKKINRTVKKTKKVVNKKLFGSKRRRRKRK